MTPELIDQRIEQYSKLCNWFWFNVVSPGYEDDGFEHTSSECRRLSNEIFALLEIELPSFDDIHRDKSPEEKEKILQRMIEYVSRNNEIPEFGIQTLEGPRIN